MACGEMVGANHGQGEGPPHRQRWQLPSGVVTICLADPRFLPPSHPQRTDVAPGGSPMLLLCHLVAASDRPTTRRQRLRLRFIDHPLFLSFRHTLVHSASEFWSRSAPPDRDTSHPQNFSCSYTGWRTSHHSSAPKGLVILVGTREDPGISWLQ